MTIITGGMLKQTSMLYQYRRSLRLVTLLVKVVTVNLRLQLMLLLVMASKKISLVDFEVNQITEPFLTGICLILQNPLIFTIMYLPLLVILARHDQVCQTSVLKLVLRPMSLAHYLPMKMHYLCACLYPMTHWTIILHYLEYCLNLV